MHMTVTIEPHERFRLHGANPCDLVAAEAEARERVDALLASLKASWTIDAACLDVGTETFFPGPGHRNDTALAICGRCPVRTDCLDEAIADETLDHGIRGGATVAARQAMRKARGVVRSCSTTCRCARCATTT